MYFASAYTLPHITPIVQKIAYIPILNGTDFELAKDRQRQQGKIVVPAAWDRFDELLYIDEDNHANDVGSMIAIYREGVLTDGGIPRPIFTFLVDRDAEVLENESGSTVEISGPSLCSVLDWISVKPYDYPTYPSAEPNWTYGGENLLTNPSFEDGSVANDRITLTIGATGGTFTLTFDGETTDPITFDSADISQVSTDIQDELVTLSTITEVSVTSEGEVGEDTDRYEFTIEITDPSGNLPAMTGNGGSLTGGAGTLQISTEDGGAITPTGWTTTQSFENGAEFSTYATGGFLVDTERVQDGTYSIRVNPLSLYGGPQQISDLVIGRRYWARGYVNPSTDTDYFRMIMRDQNEQIVKSSVPFEANFTAATWNEMLIEPFVTQIPRVALRAAAVKAVGDNPQPFWMDNFFLGEGEPPATVGKVIHDQLTAANGRAVGSFLNPTFTITHDSNGVEWDDVISVILATNDQLGQVMEQIIGLFGYDYDVVFNRDAGTIDFHIYNPGTAGTTHVHRPGILGGADYLSGGEIVKRAPKATNLFGMTDGGHWNNDADTVLANAWGAREEGVDLDGLVTPQDIDRVMVEYKAEINNYMVGGQFTLNDMGDVVPFRDFDVFDKMPVNLGTKMALRTREVVSIRTSIADGGRAEYTVAVSSEVFGSVGLAGQAEAVRQLWMKLNRGKRGDKARSGIINDPIRRDYVLLVSADGEQGSSVADVVGADISALRKARDIAINRNILHLKLSGSFLWSTEGGFGVNEFDHFAVLDINSFYISGLVEGPNYGSYANASIDVGGNVYAYAVLFNGCHLENVSFSASFYRFIRLHSCTTYRCGFQGNEGAGTQVDHNYYVTGQNTWYFPRLLDNTDTDAGKDLVYAFDGALAMIEPELIAGS